MTKDDRIKLAAEGKTILRPYWDHRKNRWTIRKYTQYGGWKRFGNSWYFSSSDALEKIDRIVEMNPGQYVKEG